MTDEELKELQEEYPNAWWNLDYDEYQFTEEDFKKAWDEDFGGYFDYCMAYEPEGWCEYLEDRYEYESDEIYGSLILEALCEEKWNIAEALDCGDEISRDTIMTCLFTKDRRKQMQWLLDHDAHRRADGLWDSWKNLCVAWDEEEQPEATSDVAELEERIKELEKDSEYYLDQCAYKEAEIRRLRGILDANGISY